MQDAVMLDSIERYIKGEMLAEERVFFEQLRKSNPAVDHMVVEHTIFLHEMDKYGDRKAVQSALEDIHNKLNASGSITNESAPKVVRLWVRYRKVIAVAASIAGITALGISMLASYLSPKANNKTLEQLNRQLSILAQKQNSLTDKINEVRYKDKGPSEGIVALGGTGFLIDPKGYIVTNAHVVKKTSTVIVQNGKGQEFETKIIYIDAAADLAFLKIVDSDFKAFTNLPYSISKGNPDLGEPIFTLGYPRDEIVYGEGYLSAKTGYAGDTLAFQIAVAANPGNSGGPVLNKNGEVIAVLSTRQISAQGAVFAIRSKNIFRAVDEIKSDSSISEPIRIPTAPSTLKNMDRIQQIKKIQDCIFIVKSY